MAVIETESPTITSVETTVAATTSATAVTTPEPSMSYGGKATKLFKESKSSKVHSSPTMSMDSVPPKSGKGMSIIEAKAGKATVYSDTKASKEMSMKVSKAEKLFRSKSSSMSI